MENQNAETIDVVEAPGAATATPVAKQRKSRFSFANLTPNWLMLVVLPVLALAFLAYGYKTGYLTQVGNKAGAAVASFSPAIAKKLEIKDKLTVAREAFAAGDIKGAVEAYRAFIASNPSDMAAHGELGNVFYTIGDLPEAAQAYFETASMAIEQNRPDIAEALLQPVIEGNPMLANQLNDKLFEAQVRANMMAQPFEGGPQQQDQPQDRQQG